MSLLIQCSLATRLRHDKASNESNAGENRSLAKDLKVEDEGALEDDTAMDDTRAFSG